MNINQFFKHEERRERAKRAVKLTDINEMIDKLVERRPNTYFKTKKFKTLEAERKTLV